VSSDINWTRIEGGILPPAAVTMPFTSTDGGIVMVDVRVPHVQMRGTSCTLDCPASGWFAVDGGEVQQRAAAERDPEAV